MNKNEDKKPANLNPISKKAEEKPVLTHVRFEEFFSKLQGAIPKFVVIRHFERKGWNIERFQRVPELPAKAFSERLLDSIPQPGTSGQFRGATPDIVLRDEVSGAPIIDESVLRQFVKDNPNYEYHEGVGVVAKYKEPSPDNLVPPKFAKLPVELLKAPLHQHPTIFPEGGNPLSEAEYEAAFKIGRDGQAYLHDDARNTQLLFGWPLNNSVDTARMALADHVVQRFHKEEQSGVRRAIIDAYRDGVAYREYVTDMRNLIAVDIQGLPEPGTLPVVPEGRPYPDFIPAPHEPIDEAIQRKVYEDHVPLSWRHDTGDAYQALNELTDRIKELRKSIEWNVPAGRHKSLAITALEDVALRAEAGILQLPSAGEQTPIHPRSPAAKNQYGVSVDDEQ